MVSQIFAFDGISVKGNYRRYPGTTRTSIIPSDYTYNMHNCGIDFRKHIFEQLESGLYKRFLGLITIIPVRSTGKGSR